MYVGTKRCKTSAFWEKISIIKLLKLFRGINILVSLCLQSRSNKSKNKELHSKLFVRLAFNIQGVLSLSLSLCRMKNIKSDSISINVMLKSTLFHKFDKLCIENLFLLLGYLFQNNFFKLILILENHCTIKIKRLRVRSRVLRVRTLNSKRV